jgi:hypothetical protein
MGHVYTQDFSTTSNSAGSRGGPLELLEIGFSEPLQAAATIASSARENAREA